MKQKPTINIAIYFEVIEVLWRSEKIKPLLLRSLQLPISNCRFTHGFYRGTHKWPCHYCLILLWTYNLYHQ